MNKQIIILVCVIILILVIAGLYYYVGNGNGDNMYIELQNSNKPHNFLDDEIKSPLDGYNYSMTFFIYINDYVENFKYWKHILHKGNELRSTDILKYTDWKELVSDMPTQNPGIWINPKSTFLRISFKIIPENDNVNDGDANHAPHSTKIFYGNIEYVDIEIPYKKMTHVAFYTENQVLYVYFNGVLRKIHKFKGNLEPNTNNMYFNQPLTYEGSLYKFNYIPYPIHHEKILEYSKDIPNVKFIPKNTRFLNFIKRFKFKDALQSFFI
jgi:hypothetical protein